MGKSDEQCQAGYRHVSLPELEKHFAHVQERRRSRQRRSYPVGV